MNNIVGQKFYIKKTFSLELDYCYNKGEIHQLISFEPERECYPVSTINIATNQPSLFTLDEFNDNFISIGEIREEQIKSILD